MILQSTAAGYYRFTHKRRNQGLTYTFNFNFAMDVFKVVNGAYHLKVGSQYKVRSNFTFKLKWEVYHQSDTGYMVELTREDKVTG